MSSFFGLLLRGQYGKACWFEGGALSCNPVIITTNVNDNPFTRKLIQELQWLRTSRFNMEKLHARFMNRYRKPRSHMLLKKPWYTHPGNVDLPSAELINDDDSTSEVIDLDDDVKQLFENAIGPLPVSPR